jgi:flagellar hook-associated protein 2
MANGGVLGLGSGAASSLNQETIDKLKKADKRATVEPLEKKVEGWDKEFEKVSEIEALAKKLQSAMKNLTLSSNSSNAFESISANTTTNSSNGTSSAVFNANDVSGLSPGTIDVYVSNLAKAETSHSAKFADKDANITNASDGGKFKITLGTDTYSFNTDGKTFQELADEINQSDLFSASIEQVTESGDKYRLVIKSANTGTENALSFDSENLTSNTAKVLNANSGDGDVNISELQAAENFIGKIDGLEYSRSSNTITLQGNLTMTAVAVDTGTYGTDNSSTTLTLERDSSLIIPAVDEFVNTYNELQNALNAEILDEDSPIYDKSMLRTMMSGLKDKIFNEFGSDNKTIFDHGFEVDYTGNLSVNTTKFAESIKDNFSDIQNFFLGDKGTDGIIGTDDDTAGFGTSLFKLLDTYDDYETGLLTSYADNMGTRKTNWEEELAKAQKALDDRYARMAAQFAEYGAVINQMEAAFGGMKMMIDQSTAKS